MKNVLLLIVGILFALNGISQNVGIGTTTPTNTLHIKSTSGDPLKIEGLQGFSPSETSVLVVDPNTGIVRHMPEPLVGTDNQNLTLGAGTVSTAILQINGGSNITLTEGNNIQFTESGNNLTISASGDGTGTDNQNLTLGAGTTTTSILNMESGSDITLIEGNNIQLTESGNNLTITATGDGTGTDNQNLTLGAGTTTTSILNMENGSDITIQEGTNIQITESGNTMTINASGDGTGTDNQNLTLGAGTTTTSILNMESGSDITLIEGNNIQLTESGNNLTITATGDGTGTDNQNLTLGAGTTTTSILNMENGSDITIQEGTNIQITEIGNTMTINASGDGTGTDNQNLTVSAGGSNSSILNMESGTDVTINGGSGISVTESGSTITIAQSGGTTLASGTYTPTVTEINASVGGINSVETHNYLRVGNQVHLAGTIFVDWVADGNGFIYVTLPIASNFTGVRDLNGSINLIVSGPYATFNGSHQAIADTGSDRMRLMVQNAEGAITVGYQYSVLYTVK